MKNLSALVQDAIALNKKLNGRADFRTFGVARRFARRVLALDTWTNEFDAILNEKDLPKSLVLPLANVLYEQISTDD